MLIAFIVFAFLSVTVVAYQAHLHSEAEAKWSAERDKLLDRIQAPETLGRKSPDASKVRPRVLPLNDDNAFKEAYENSLNGNTD